MKKDLQLLLLLVFSLSGIHAQTIWNGPNITFTKAPLADPTLEENQDRITDNVWITRGNSQGLFNANSEGSHSILSPAGTEWAKGTTAEIESLTFTPWKAAVNNNPPGSVNQNYVLHLIAEDIYIDVRFTQWGMQAAGGGSFSYVRSTDPTLSIEEEKIDNLVSIAPNPASNYIEITGNVVNKNYEIYEIGTGRKVALGVVESNRQVYVGEIENGSYLFVVRGQQPVRFIKIDN